MDPRWIRCQWILDGLGVSGSQMNWVSVDARWIRCQLILDGLGVS